MSNSALSKKLHNTCITMEKSQESENCELRKVQLLIDSNEHDENKLNWIIITRGDTCFGRYVMTNSIVSHNEKWFGCFYNFTRSMCASKWLCTVMRSKSSPLFGTMDSNCWTMKNWKLRYYRNFPQSVDQSVTDFSFDWYFFSVSVSDTGCITFIEAIRLFLRLRLKILPSFSSLSILHSFDAIWLTTDYFIQGSFALGKFDTVWVPRIRRG